MEVRARNEKEEKDGTCTFWFVDADKIRNWKPGAANEWSLPRFQVLKQRGWLTPRKMSLADACKNELFLELLAVSHRWFDESHPDKNGDQMQEILEFLNLPENSGIRHVWYDFWCMPQKEGRTPAEKEAFDFMLGNVNSIYLGCRVLILLDLSYLSRFWTQFEAWLSMQTACKEGLRPSTEDEKRYVIVPILNGNSLAADMLSNMWADKKPKEAYQSLKKDDVTVTSLKDKQDQLPKLLALDGRVRETMEEMKQAAAESAMSA